MKEEIGVRKFIDNAKNAGTNVINKAGGILRTRWVDIILLLIVFLLLGVFDIFVLKQSDKFLSPEYWAHAGTRIGAYIVAGILGVRYAYPKVKDNCTDLTNALNKNRKLLFYKEYDGDLFSDFIDGINKEVKISAWKSKIRKKLKKLDRHAKDFFLLYYHNKDDKYFERYTKGFMHSSRYKFVKWRAERYCDKRKTLESFIDKEYIENNIHILNVKYPHVYEHNFDRIEATETGYKFYKTTANVTGNAAKRIGMKTIITIIFVLIIGLIAIDINEELVEQRILGIVTIIVNSIIDIGFTLWRFVSGVLSCNAIVRQEDLRAVIDQNELLIAYKKTLSEESKAEIEKTIAEQEQNEKEDNT